uniref:Uncharacterized protein n=1 Tax=Oryza glumipatula TaxID=40148 RepID=A0A0D9YA01_9ORYZ
MAAVLALLILLSATPLGGPRTSVNSASPLRAAIVAYPVPGSLRAALRRSPLHRLHATAASLNSGDLSAALHLVSALLKYRGRVTCGQREEDDGAGASRRMGGGLPVAIFKLIDDIVIPYIEQVGGCSWKKLGLKIQSLIADYIFL